MSERQPTPSVHEKFVSAAETSFGLDHGDELVAGHPPRLASPELTYECHQPDPAADLDGKVGSLEHDGSPFPEENSTCADGNLTEGNHRVCTGHTPSPQSQGSLTLTALQRAHVERQEEWCPDQKPDISFRGNELGGECGEAQNVIKKLERERHGWRGSRDTIEHLAEELADVIHCAVLVAITAGIEIESAVIAKFNSTSAKNVLSTRLPLARRPQ